jgi:hypothetical protein
MAGGGGFKKVVISALLDRPAACYLGGAAFLYLVR